MAKDFIPRRRGNEHPASRPQRYQPTQRPGRYGAEREQRSDQPRFSRPAGRDWQSGAPAKHADYRSRNDTHEPHEHAASPQRRAYPDNFQQTNRRDERPSNTYRADKGTYRPASPQGRNVEDQRFGHRHNSSPARPDSYRGPVQRPARPGEFHRPDERPSGPGGYRGPVQRPARPGEFHRSDERPSGPGGYRGPEQRSTRPGEFHGPDERPTGPGGYREPGQRPTRPGGYRGPDEHPGRSGEFRRPDERPHYGNQRPSYPDRDQHRDKQWREGEGHERPRDNRERGYAPRAATRPFADHAGQGRPQNRPFTRPAGQRDSYPSAQRSYPRPGRPEEQFEGDYERFNTLDEHGRKANPPRGFVQREDSGRESRSKDRFVPRFQQREQARPKSQIEHPPRQFQADKEGKSEDMPDDNERHITRLASGRVLKGPRQAQRQQAEFWDEVEHDAEDLLESVQLPAAEPPEEDQAGKPAVRTTRHQLAHKASVAAARSKKVEKPGKSAKKAQPKARGPRPSQRGFKWPKA